MLNKMKLALMVAGMLWATVCGAAQPSVERLIDDLRLGNDAARVRASQQLPHYGASAVPGLSALLKSEDPAVVNAATQCLWYTVNELARPAMEADRKAASEALMPLLAPGRTRSERETGLRMLGAVVPEGMDVAPVAALLLDKELSDMARYALERIGTTQARAALRAALGAADAKAACALMVSLSNLRDTQSVPAMLKLATHEQPVVRAAAARALAWTGDPVVVEAVRRVRAQTDAATAFDSADAQLRLADAMADQGGNWNLAMTLYKEILDSATDTRLKGAAIVGLARHGDESVVDPIVSAVEAAGPVLQPCLVTAFGDLPGFAASKRIVAAYPSLDPSLRLLLLPVLGRRADPAVLPVLAEAAQSPEPAVRLAALRALGECRQPDAVKTLSQAAASANEDESRVAQTSTERLG